MSKIYILNFGSQFTHLISNKILPVLIGTESDRESIEIIKKNAPDSINLSVIANPNPWAPPVTIATLSLRLNLIILLLKSFYLFSNCVIRNIDFISILSNRSSCNIIAFFI